MIEHPLADGEERGGDGKLPQEIEARITARAFGAVHNPGQGPAVRQVLAELLTILDASSTDGVI